MSTPPAVPAQPQAKPPKAPKRHRSTFDWERIRRDYEADHLSTREICDQYHVSNGALFNRIKTEHWSRGDQAAKVRKATQAAMIEVDASTVREQLESDSSAPATTGAELERRSILYVDPVAAAAELNRQVITRHRSDITAARATVDALRVHLNAHLIAIPAGRPAEECQEGQEPIEGTGQALGVTALKELAGPIKTLVAGIESVVAMERKAFGLDIATESSDDFDSTIRKIMQERK